MVKEEDTNKSFINELVKATYELEKLDKVQALIRAEYKLMFDDEMKGVED